MGKKQTVCSCGAAFDENGICTECGKKRPRSAGYRVFHGILIVIASLFLLGCLSATLCGRHYILYHNISGGLQNSRLSDFKVDGQTVTELIRKEYVQDERVLPEDIASAVDEMDVTGYLAEKVDALGKMLRGETDTYPTFSSDEVVKLLENNESALYSKCMLIIEDKDKADIKAALDEPFGIVNDTMDILYGSKAGRAIARFRVSVWRAVLDLVLLGLLLWRWIKVRRYSGKSGCGAVRGMGWVFFVPSVIVLIFCAVTALTMAFKSDSVVSFYTLVKGIRTPHWLLAPLTAGFGIFLMALSGYIRSRILYKQENKAVKQVEMRESRTSPAMDAAPSPRPAQTAPPQTATDTPVSRTMPARTETTTTTAVPVQPKAMKICIGCGREIPETAQFCIYCGTSQNPKKSEEQLEQEIEDILNQTPISAPKIQLTKTESPEPAAPQRTESGNQSSPMARNLDAYLNQNSSQNTD